MSKRRNRYAERFAALEAKGQGAFVPFTVLGDPDPETSLDILRAFAAGGADMLELGIPFSDPIADGPTIQSADVRALEAGVTPPQALDLVRRFREEEPDIPIGLLLYANLVNAPGIEVFYRRCAEAGVDSVLVADVPLEEAGPFRSAARKAGIAPVFLATPTATDERLERLVEASKDAYLYVVTRTGVTGRDTSLAASAAPLLKRIRGIDPGISTLVGFGVGKPTHVRQSLQAGASGAISGSAVVEVIGRHVKEGKRLSKAARQRMCDDVRGFVTQMKKATR